MTAPRRILVTGGAGYVGSHCAKLLARSGIEPVTIDHLGRGHRAAVRYGPLEVGDIADRDFVAGVIRRWQPDAALHFAAVAYVAESVANPSLYYRNNVAGTLSFVETLLAHGIHRLVFSSSCATYGIPDQVPIAEGQPQRPINPYGASKLMAERMLADLEAATPLRAVVLRYFNAAGADLDGELGEDHEPETHLIPLALRAARPDGAPLQVFGTDYPTADGTCVRDFVHVDDLARAHVAALGALDRGSAGFACNLGSGAGLSVRQILAAVERVTGRPVAWEARPRRPGDPPVLVADARLAARHLGWTPLCSDIDTIVASAGRWAHRGRP